jgi:hypothetical protein
VQELAGQELAELHTADPESAESQEEIAQDELSELAGRVKLHLPSLKALKKAGSGAPKRSWSVEAKAIMDALVTMNKELVDRNEFLRSEERRPKTDKDLASYGKVQGMYLSANAKKHENVPNSDACELKCSMDPGCKSFSFCATKRSCLIAPLALGYRPDSVFYAKQKGSDEYVMYPGMFEAIKSSPVVHDKTLTECRTGCDTLGVQCAGFSFRANKGACAYTSESLHYDKEWSYHEKPGRQFEMGHPQEVNAEKTIDLQKRELDKYWRELSYDRKVNDKRKVIKLEKKINGIKDAAVNLVDELRVLKSTYAGVKAKVATMKRISKTAANALNNAVTEVTRAKGSLEQANVARALADEKVQKREQELTDQVDQNAELTPEDRSADLSDLMGSDAKLQRARSEQLTSHNHHQLCTQELLGAEKVLKGAQEQQDSMDKQTIVILTKLKNIEGEKTQKTNRLKSLIGKAKDVANVVRKEEELMTPPSSVLAPPSMHHQLSWDQKADEANANAAAARLASMIKLGHGPPTEI